MTALPLLVLAAQLAVTRPASAGPPAAAPAAQTVHRWADGLTLVVRPVSGAPVASMRLVVRAGGALDPMGKAGLAHVVEHVLVEQGERGRTLMQEVRRAGGVLNAHTTQSWTSFELDAAAPSFVELAERYLRLVTGPVWLDANVDGAVAVVDRESDLRGGEEVSLLDSALFPSPSQSGSLIGSRESRDQLRLEDVQRFFRTHYTPGRTSIILTGAVSVEEAIALVERAYLIPPVSGPSQAAPDVLNVPLEQNVPSLVTATIQGYVLDPGDREVCDELAALLQLRMVLAIREGGPHVSDVGVRCARLRGYDVVFAVAYTSTFDAPELPAEMDAVFRRVRAGHTVDEKARLDRRLRRQRERIVGAPEALADAIALHVAEMGVAHVEEALPGTLHSSRRLQDAAARSLAPARRFQLNFALRD